MIRYSKYRYIFPPRPENKIPFSELENYDIDIYLSQPKLNGSNMTVYTDGKDVVFMNRHNQKMSNVVIPKEEFLKLHRGKGWVALNGEYMNKSKKDTKGDVFNHKFVIFDILVYNGKQTVSSTFEYRTKLIEDLYNPKSYDGFIDKISVNVFAVKTFFSTFTKLYEKLVSVDMYEGLVLKKRNAKLKNGVSKTNNVGSQIKVRKETKNYKF